MHLDSHIIADTGIVETSYTEVCHNHSPLLLSLFITTAVTVHIWYYSPVNTSGMLSDICFWLFANDDHRECFKFYLIKMQ